MVAGFCNIAKCIFHFASKLKNCFGHAGGKKDAHFKKILTCCLYLGNAMTGWASCSSLLALWKLFAFSAKWITEVNFWLPFARLDSSVDASLASKYVWLLVRPRCVLEPFSRFVAVAQSVFARLQRPPNKRRSDDAQSRASLSKLSIIFIWTLYVAEAFLWYLCRLRKWPSHCSNNNLWLQSILQVFSYFLRLLSMCHVSNFNNVSDALATNWQSFLSLIKQFQHVIANSKVSLSSLCT